MKCVGCGATEEVAGLMAAYGVCAECNPQRYELVDEVPIAKKYGRYKMSCPLPDLHVPAALVLIDHPQAGPLIAVCVPGAAGAPEGIVPFRAYRARVHPDGEISLVRPPSFLRRLWWRITFRGGRSR